uniref:Uncharacterized protein n=2 Tax=Babesia bovis TaxID=5865 RepID=A7AU84_BABBO|eukprot:XP_001610063.1 hypothetical protein [Babesia bovis T2Bo]
MYFNPVEEFIYGYRLNGAYIRKYIQDVDISIGKFKPDILPPLVRKSIAHKCIFKPNRINFACSDTLLVMSSIEDGAKVFSFNTDYVELICHFRPILRNDIRMDRFHVLSCHIALADLQRSKNNMPSIFVSDEVTCQYCKAMVTKDVELCEDEIMPYTVVLDCIMSLSGQPPVRAVVHSHWPSGETYIHNACHLCAPVDPWGVQQDYIIMPIQSRITGTTEYNVVEQLQNYWSLEPYMHDETRFLFQAEKPVDCNHGDSLLDTPVESLDHLEQITLIAVYTPNGRIGIFDDDCNLIAHTFLPIHEEYCNAMDVNRNGTMLCLIGGTSVYVFRLRVSRETNGELTGSIEFHMQFPPVVGVGRREEVVSACFGKDTGSRWLYASVVRGTLEAVMYVVDVMPIKGRDPVKRVLNMNSSVFPCITQMVSLESSLLVMPRHQRYLIQLTQEHLDNTDDTFSRQFCHFPVLDTNKEVLMLNGPVPEMEKRPPPRYDILLLERDREIQLTNRISNRLNIARWLDALYQYNALCMYKGRDAVVSVDVHEGLLPSLRRVPQQYPFGYDTKRFYNSLLGLEFTGSPSLMRAQCYEWVREALSRTGFANPMYALDIVYDDKLPMVDYICAKVCIAQWENPADVVFSLRTNDFLYLQLCNFARIAQRMDLQTESQGVVTPEKTMLYKKISEIIPRLMGEEPELPMPQSRAALERDAFELMRQQLVPELMSIPEHKLKKIIRDRLYRLRKKLSMVERYKREHELNDVRPEFSLEEIMRNDCRLPIFRESAEAHDILLCEFAMRVRMKVLSAFYKAQKEGAPDLEDIDIPV